MPPSTPSPTAPHPQARKMEVVAAAARAPAPFEQSVTFFRVRDLEAADRFFAGQLRLPRVATQRSTAGDIICLIFRSSDDTFLGFNATPTDCDLAQVGMMYTLLVPDVAAAFARMAADGVVFDGDPSVHGENVHSAFFSGPDGQRLEVEASWPALSLRTAAATTPFVQQCTFLYADDVDAAAEFYGGKMGLPLVMTEEQPGRCRIFRVSNGGFIGVNDRTDRPRETATICFTFLCADVDAEHARLVASGVVFETPPKYNVAGAGGDGEHKSAFFRDPAGFLLEVGPLMHCTESHHPDLAPRSCPDSPASLTIVLAPACAPDPNFHRPELAGTYSSAGGKRDAQSNCRGP
eukprot:SAG22_NODE_524_length_9488_cov_16.150602_3_plen_349_part_00